MELRSDHVAGTSNAPICLATHGLLGRDAYGMITLRTMFAASTAEHPLIARDQDTYQ